MTKLIMLLATIVMFMWIQQAAPCLFLPMDPHRYVKARMKKEMEIEAEKKRIEEVNRKEELYNEEMNLLQQEPEYFTEENTDLSDFASILPEDYNHSNNEETGPEMHEDENLKEEMHEDYPEFPAIKNDEDYDYSEFENITMQDLAEDEEEDVYDDEKYEEFYGEYFPNEKRDKRDTAEVIDGIVESGEKLLSGNMVGSITTFLKTLAKPVFHYFIKSDNDNAMTKFTHRILPETGFRHSPNALMISKNAREGHGEKVWSTLADS